MRVARFKVFGRFTGGGPTQATVTIDRSAAPLFEVRPYKRKRTFAVPLGALAEYVVWHLTKKEIAEKKKRRRRKSKRP